VQHVEIRRCVSDVVEEIQVRGDIRPQRIGIQPQRLLASRDELRFSACVGRREQDDLVAAVRKSVAKIRYDSFRATI
jgi:hypothetical protein